jgi:SnoaL-like domain
MTDRVTDPALVEELRALSGTYAAGVDRRDLPLFLSAFDPDGSLTIDPTGGADPPSQPTLQGHHQMARVVKRIAVYQRTFHVIGQSDYRTSEDGVSGQVHCIAHHRWRDTAEKDHVMYIRYHDEYRNGTDGRWLIFSRVVGIDWSETRVVDVPGHRPT